MKKTKSTTNITYPLRHPAIFATLVGGILYIGGQFVATQLSEANQQVDANREIQVQGTGMAKATPTQASITLGVQIEPQETAELATQQLAEKVTSVMEALRGLGVAKEDIKTTNVSTNPVREFPEGRSELVGYEASEQVQVTIRDRDRAGEIISRVTQEGVNQVGNIQFSVEDDADVIAQAEAEAIADARERAERLAQQLDVRIGKVKTFSSSIGQPGQPIPFYAAEGRGGDVSLPVSPGTEETTVTVHITYQLL